MTAHGGRRADAPRSRRSRRPRRQATPFGLVLLDANMPDMDGFEVAAEIRGGPELAGATVMMLTSSGKYGDQSRVQRAGHRGVPHQAGVRRRPQCRDRPRDRREACRRPPCRGTILGGHPRANEHRGRPVRILLVEDNVVNQRVAVGLLTRRGHQVTVASDGREALAALEREPSTSC